MLKAIGAAFVLAGTLFGGYSQVFRLRKRERLLRDLLESLQYMQAELCFRAAPLGEVLGRLEGGMRAEVGRFYGDWRAELGRKPDGSRGEMGSRVIGRWLRLLSEEEQQVFFFLFGILGRYDLEVQKNALEEAGVKLRHFTEKAEEERARLSRVYMVLSAALGLGVVLVCL